MPTPNDGCEGDHDFAIFENGRYVIDDFVIDITPGGFRCGNAYVYLTSAEYKIVGAISTAGPSGYSLFELPEILGKVVSERSVQIVRTHIYNIRKKLDLIGREMVYLKFDLTSMRYYMVARYPDAFSQGSEP